MSKRLKRNQKFTPCPVEPGDECFTNGIFEFNISRLIDHIAQPNSSIQLVTINLVDYPGFSKYDDDHVSSVDCGIPIIIAEIAPGRYNIIDGNHRAEKGRRTGASTLQAYQVTVDDHIPFLTCEAAYIEYVVYWNDKVAQLRRSDRLTK